MERRVDWRIGKRSGLVFEGLTSGGHYTIDHLAKGTKGEAILFEEIKGSVLKKDFFCVQAFLTGEENDIDVRVDVAHTLEGVQAVHDPIQIVVQNDDGGVFVQLRNTGFSVGIEMNICAKRFQFLGDKTLVDDIILYDKNDRLLIEFHD